MARKGFFRKILDNVTKAVEKDLKQVVEKAVEATPAPRPAPRPATPAPRPATAPAPIAITRKQKEAEAVRNIMDRFQNAAHEPTVIKNVGLMTDQELDFARDSRTTTSALHARSQVQPDDGSINPFWYHKTNVKGIS